MKKGEEMQKIYLITISLLFISCAEKFPSDHIIYIDQNKQICESYKIDQDEVKFTFDKSIKYSECPVVYGFEQKQVGLVTSWIRRMKKKLEECQ